MRVLNPKANSGRVDCHCGAELEFEEADIKLRYYAAEEPDTPHPYVECPECGAKCEVYCSKEVIRRLEI